MSSLPLTPPASDADTPGAADPGSREPPRAPVSWAPWTAPVALLAALSATVFVGVLIGVAVVVGGGSVHAHQATIDIVGTFIQDGALIGAAVFFASLSSGRLRPEQFGLRRTPLGPAVGLVVLGLGAFLAFALAWGALLHSHQKDQLVHELGADHAGVARYAVAVLVCVAAPIAEELFFRGYFFTALRNWHGTPLAVALTGLTFGAVHLGSSPAVDLLPLAFLGMVLCLLYLRTRSLYPGIALHVVNNCLAFGVLEKWGWQIPVLMVASLTTVSVCAWGVERRTAVPSPAPSPSPA